MPKIAKMFASAILCTFTVLILAVLLVKADNQFESKINVFDIKNPLVLSCNISAESNSDILWEKNDNDVSKIADLKGRYKIITDEKKFIIDKTEENDAGNYSCSIKKLNKRQDFHVIANVAVRVPANIGVVEGEKLTIICTVVGTNPELSWEIGNITITETTGRYILKEEDGLQNAKFIIENIVMEDRGEYTCIANNLATRLSNYEPVSYTSFVRVKGKLAALWPFLGICAEVFILCAIILIYEKRRNKIELEESDTDPNTEQEKLKPQRN